eukprot:2052428-Rhodomonas_salina.2
MDGRKPESADAPTAPARSIASKRDVSLRQQPRAVEKIHARAVCGASITHLDAVGKMHVVRRCKDAPPLVRSCIARPERYVAFRRQRRPVEPHSAAERCRAVADSDA